MQLFWCANSSHAAFFFFALVVKRGDLRVPVMLRSKKKMFPRAALGNWKYGQPEVGGQYCGV
jgi:hypothetical protein